MSDMPLLGPSAFPSPVFAVVSRAALAKPFSSDILPFFQWSATASAPHGMCQGVWDQFVR